MKRKELKYAFTKAMNRSEYWEAHSDFMNKLLKDIPFEAQELHWNYVFYSCKLDRKELFQAYGYKDLRYNL